ncbi:MAG: hypothetical protein Q8S15_00340 [Erysipelotrichaceae bacterium]|nr:hypothetical protein [Erysipelotrichaceae bacterium]
MTDLWDFLEPLIQGRWEYFGGLVAASLLLLVIRSLRLYWIEKQQQKDAIFVESHQAVPIKDLQKKMWFILSSIIILLFIVLPGSLYLTVEILKSIDSINPGIALLFVFIIFIILLVLIVVQSVRFRRLNRRIKKMV